MPLPLTGLTDECMKQAFLCGIILVVLVAGVAIFLSSSTGPGISNEEERAVSDPVGDSAESENIVDNPDVSLSEPEEELPKEVTPNFDFDVNAVELSYEEVVKLTSDELLGLSKVTIPVLVYGGKFFPYPEQQFTLEALGECDIAHYSVAFGVSLDLIEYPQPKHSCRWRNSVHMIQVDPQEVIDWFDKRSVPETTAPGSGSNFKSMAELLMDRF